MLRMAICAIAMALLTVATNGQFDLESILSKMDKPLPADALGYAKKAGPYVKILTSNIENEQCKTNWEGLADKVLAGAESTDEFTVLQLVKQVCAVGSECFTEAIAKLQSMVEGNALIKGAAEAQLKKYGMSVEQIATGAPLIFETACAQISSFSGGVAEKEL
ncbi:Hypothetical Protein FCC1311_093522 [Hondaea fermentalgiana]|uniref:Uncharacterized protein n=1 Tax=Hondaea fermentalgiana TaxID=2315210 RepID=A0A2R5GTP6_9STRA|nr:Hypothetical Protein FCC1311_093522 [Hondaea fermentalgiana]|eukprot:GBG33128.1 Hypothetical Protein FCC1311_093522 [Hondaea fermentalgiana]